MHTTEFAQNRSHLIINRFCNRNVRIKRLRKEKGRERKQTSYEFSVWFPQANGRCERFLGAATSLSSMHPSAPPGQMVRWSGQSTERVSRTNAAHSNVTISLFFKSKVWSFVLRFINFLCLGDFFFTFSKFYFDN